MQPRSIEDRVTLLENEMQALRDLPGRVTSLEVQMVQFRAEVRAEFSATRVELGAELRAVDGGLHEKFDAKIDDLKVGLKAEMNALHELALEEMHALHAVARLETDNAIERSMGQTRTLFEDAIRRINITKHG